MIFLFNIFAIYVTYLLNSVWHAILENFRPGAVWATDLALYYLLTRKQFGEAWTHPGSEVQLLGMAIMIFGTAVYNASVRLLHSTRCGKAEFEWLTTTLTHSRSPAMLPL